MLFHNVHATILLVDTGIPQTAEEVADIMAAEDAPYQPPLLLDEVLAVLPHVRLVTTLDQRPTDAGIISLLRFSVEEIVAIAGAENLHLDWDEDDLPDDAETDEPSEDVAPAEQDTTDADHDDGGAFAEALRKAMEQGKR